MDETATDATATTVNPSVAEKPVVATGNGTVKSAAVVVAKQNGDLKPKLSDEDNSKTGVDEDPDIGEKK